MAEQPTAPQCDVCGGTDPPRNPLWRSNTDRVCDPCWVFIQERVAEAAASVPAPEQQEAVRLALRRLDERWSALNTMFPENSWDVPESIRAFIAEVRAAALATPPPVPAAPGLDVERLRLAMERAINNTDDLEAIAAEYARLHPADPEEA